jgi:hypothetical protein
MQLDTVHRLAFDVEDVLAPVIVSVDGPPCVVRELAFAELHHGMALGREKTQKVDEWAEKGVGSEWH